MIENASTPLDALKALRDKLANEIDNCQSNRDLAALARVYLEVESQIAELAPLTKGSALDEIMQRRLERQQPDTNI